MTGDLRSTDELVRIALAADDEVRWEIIHALHWRGTREVFEAARRLCSSRRACERSLGADVIAQLGLATRLFAEETVNQLLAMLGDEDASVVYSAALGLGHNREQRIVEPLCRLWKHADKDVRFAVVYGLLTFEVPSAISALIALSRDDDPEVRDWATFGLGLQIEVDTVAIREALLARARDSDRATRANALLGLARRGERRAVEPLLEALRSDVVGDSEVEAAALYGSSKLYGALVDLRAWWDVDRALLDAAIGTCQPLS